MPRVIMSALTLAAAVAARAQPGEASGGGPADRSPCRDGRAWALVVGVAGEPLLGGERGWIPGERVEVADLTGATLAEAASRARRERPGDVLTLVLVASPDRLSTLAGEGGVADSLRPHVDRVFVVVTEAIEPERGWEFRRGIIGEGLPVPSSEFDLWLTGLVASPGEGRDARSAFLTLRDRARRLPGDFDGDGCVEVEPPITPLRVEGEDVAALRDASLHVHADADLNMDGAFDGDAGPPACPVTQWGLDFMWFVTEARWSVERDER